MKMNLKLNNLFEFNFSKLILFNNKINCHLNIILHKICIKGNYRTASNHFIFSFP